ncbi:hypothetical protein SAMN05444397_101818 [Flavobacterium aquidurense]|uniref:Exosortase/archaeosortase family protein n=2 Tax=Flavobacterium frigidimaris TaxID=262320 RepID=A0ABX4BWI0_FLAFR|nr:hypothetical protein B0A65_01925 [Flavobacterium frigidimaris]SDY51119.1 hypothetical protein SAMN05444397_101818 [Flavobacterium aquidurense]
MKTGAAAVAIIYILVQTFQWWVFEKVPDTGNTINDFLSGGNNLNIYRSWLMLLSMFGLLYLFFTICFEDFTQNKGWRILAFSGFFIFCFLELFIRSIELFFVQGYLVDTYATANTEDRAIIIKTVISIQQLWWALYFPLGLSQLLASSILAGLYLKSTGIDRLIKVIFIINGCRLFIRMLDSYLHIDILGISTLLNDELYLPLVIIMFGLKAIWLVKKARLIM